MNIVTQNAICVKSLAILAAFGVSSGTRSIDHLLFGFKVARHVNLPPLHPRSYRPHRPANVQRNLVRRPPADHGLITTSRDSFIEVRHANRLSPIACHASAAARTAVQY